MLTESQMKEWISKNQFSFKTQQFLQNIRSSEPFRRADGGYRSVTVRYPSQKMQKSIAAESNKVAFVGILGYEHEKDDVDVVVEYYDEPTPITLEYEMRRKDGRFYQGSHQHTPDYLVIRKLSAGFEEWKEEEELAKLAKEQPNRYFYDEEQGCWRCPPGEIAAAQYGLYYRVRTPTEFDWKFIRNIKWLARFWHPEAKPVDDETTKQVTNLLQANYKGISLKDLCVEAPFLQSEEVHKLIADGKIYVDLHGNPLVDAERCFAFPDKESAAEYSILHESDDKNPARYGDDAVKIAIGVEINWDGKHWRIINIGKEKDTSKEESVTLQTIDESDDISMPLRRLKLRIQKGNIRSVKREGLRNPNLDTADLLWNKASPEDRKFALNAYKQIKPILKYGDKSKVQVSDRQIRRWKNLYRTAQQKFGRGIVGLLPKISLRGNRLPRFHPIVEGFITQSVVKFQSKKRPRKKHLYRLFKRACIMAGFVPPSEKTFNKRINKSLDYAAQLARLGHRGAYKFEPQYIVDGMTIPRHGDRVWEIAHLDHTQMDVEVVDPATGENLGRPWVTVLIDAYSRRILAIYITFHAPSIESCMMALRLCVKRYGRLPESIVVDKGPEFRSVYFESLLAFYEITKIERKTAKPRFGSIIERYIGTFNVMFVHFLEGNTQATQDVRQVTKSTNPQNRAAWQLGPLYKRAEEFCYEKYDKRPHEGLDDLSPREVFEASDAWAGCPEYLEIPYNAAFIRNTCIPIRGETAKIHAANGIRFLYRYFWNDLMREGGIEETFVEVHHDPVDAGYVYAYLKGEWRKCISNAHERFDGYTAREVEIAIEVLRARRKMRQERLEPSELEIAEFLSSIEEEEQYLLEIRRLRQSQMIDVEINHYEGDLASVPNRSMKNTKTLDTPQSSEVMGDNPEDEPDIVDPNDYDNDIFQAGAKQW